MATRNNRKFVDPCGLKKVGDGNAPYLSMLCNNIVLSGSAIDNTEPNYIQYIMATCGGICYIRENNKWAEFRQHGKSTRTGMPRKIRIRGNDSWGQQIDVDGVNYCIFPANVEFAPPVDLIDKKVHLLEEVEKNILQNLDNLRELSYIETEAPETSQALIRLDEARREGQTHGVLQKKGPAEFVGEVKSLTANAQNYLETYINLKMDARQELYEIVGVAKMVEKGERRIIGEVDLANDSASAFIDLIIESINKYAKFYNVDIQAERKIRVSEKNEEGGVGNELDEGE